MQRISTERASNSVIAKFGVNVVFRMVGEINSTLLAVCFAGVVRCEVTHGPAKVQEVNCNSKI